MDLNLKDKVVLITGGGKGIGAAIARACARENAKTVIVDRDAESGRGMAKELQSLSVESEAIEADLTSPANCKSAAEAAAKRFGRIDALVNNAGINDKVGLESGNPEEFVHSLERNLLHYYCMAHYALAHLKRTRGAIVNISSKTAVTGQGGTSGYVAAKGGVLGLTREWAVELLPFGIRVNAIVPAEVMTPLYRQWLNTFPNPDEKLKDVTQLIPFEKRMTSPDEIAAMAVFLISSQASHITGQHLYVDGGYVHLDRAAT
jgi:L-fucose dehydrogenase